MSVSETPLELSLPARLEGLLFVAVEPVAPAQLAGVLEMTVTVIDKALEELDQELETTGDLLARL